ncbi:predicted protein [Uncinocarpus reesii 1704]|uniref:tRNA dimethylallyltransferase n=1 Tax=Uncinocarpus reesii (strain UAMH 1704) TaxID=336963 RepID=C4JP75_UNCRE|nr:uncharacterized protein UREG_03134 [Uncinocarpus reesii 1704]EEP78289.1 predicted protein [Uncinocarpus reesii 1704]
MLEKLRELDPVMAERWHPNESRKIRRSLQICLQTGRPVSEIYKEQKMQLRKTLEANTGQAGTGDIVEPSHLRFPTLLFWVYSDKSVLRQRLDNRVNGMIDQGLLSEAQQMFNYLQEKEAKNIHVDRTRGVWVSIGFKELDPYITALSSGQTSPENLQKLKMECVESVKTATKQYSNSQLKWIRGKLWNLLDLVGASDHLYVLDSTDVGDWDNAVRLPGERVTEAFLSGKPRPHPSEVSKIAKELFKLKQQRNQSPSEDLEIRKSCDVCNLPGMTEEQWHIHIKGKRHKNAVKGAEKRAQRERYLARQRECAEGEGLGAQNARAEMPNRLNPSGQVEIRITEHELTIHTEVS